MIDYIKLIKKNLGAFFRCDAFLTLEFEGKWR